MKRWILAFAVCLAACSGGPTYTEVLAANKATTDALRARVQAILSKLPAKGTVNLSYGKPLEPRLTWTGSDPRNSAAILPVELMAGAKPEFDLTMEGPLNYVLAWSGEPSTLSQDVRDDSASESFVKAFEEAKQPVYAIVYRSVRYEKPRAVSESQYDGGAADLEAFVARLETGEILAACRVSANPDEEISFQYRQGDDKAERLAAAASSSLWSNTRKALADCINAQTGAAVRAD